MSLWDTDKNKSKRTNSKLNQNDQIIQRLAASTTSLTPVTDTSTVQPLYARDGVIRVGQDAYNSGTGFWIGVDGDGVAKLSVGDSASNSLTWNGTSLNITGGITATTGSIGGFNIGSDYIEDAANSFGLASTVTGGDDVRFWAGASFANRDTAPFKVTESGIVTASDGTKSFTISGSGSPLSAQVLDDSTSQVLFDIFQKDTAILSDGATDVDINAAIAYLSARNGGIVYLRNGTYLCGADITLANDITIEGETAGGVTLDFQTTAHQIVGAGTSVYTTGTVAITNASTTVVGTGTTFISGYIGDYIQLAGRWFLITAVTDGTHLTIDQPFDAASVTGVSTLIAATASGMTLQNFTVQNSTHASGAVSFRYVTGVTCDTITMIDSTIGLNVRNCYTVFLNNFSVITCGTGFNFADSAVGTVYNFYLYASTAVNFLASNIYNMSVSNFTNSSAGTNNFTLTNCSNWGFYDADNGTATGKGIEMISCADIEIFAMDVHNNGSDGIKLTSGNSRITIHNVSLVSNTGYGINIADATSSNTVITGCGYSSNTAGSLNDTSTTTMKTSNTPDNTTNNNFIIGVTEQTVLLDQSATQVSNTLPTSREFLTTNKLEVGSSKSLEIPSSSSLELGGSLLAGNLINVKHFPAVGTTGSSYTYTPPKGLSFIIVEAVGGGGGGAGNGTAATNNGGGGGGGGAYVWSKIDALELPASVTITAGAGGLGQSANVSGDDGGSSSFIGLGVVLAAGGTGGAGGAGGLGGSGGAEANSSGKLILTGAVGGGGLSAVALGGSGGSPAHLGSGAGSRTGSAAGVVGAGYGGGGGGGSRVASGGQPGGNGAPGIVIVYEYA